MRTAALGQGLGRLPTLRPQHGPQPAATPRRRCREQGPISERTWEGPRAIAPFGRSRACARAPPTAPQCVLPLYEVVADTELERRRRFAQPLRHSARARPPAPQCFPLQADAELERRRRFAQPLRDSGRLRAISRDLVGAVAAFRAALRDSTRLRATPRVRAVVALRAALCAARGAASRNLVRAKAALRAASRDLARHLVRAVWALPRGASRGASRDLLRAMAAPRALAALRAASRDLADSRARAHLRSRCAGSRGKAARASQPCLRCRDLRAR